MSDDSDNSDDANINDLFASYYGIEETVESKNEEGEEDEEELGNIDSPKFDTSRYVHTILNTQQARELLQTDVALVHDIRTLDSDMQMLVYENYNKFIAATETIRRMKSNVEAMDADMNTVKAKMGIISSGSESLDTSLDSKNRRVQKLVKVQSLLKRLEFLSELPETLTKMIESGQYDSAVQLYRRTNRVLTRYGNVLSFKNIQQRTEAMMAAMGTQIMDGLDDPKIDSTQVTHFVSILVNMCAPLDKIAEKMLTAHRGRSLRIVKLFSASMTKTASDAPADSTVGQEGSGVHGGKSGVAKARQFHQILVVGLIEACKALQELYGLDPADADALRGDPVKVQSAVAALHSLTSSMMVEVSRCLTSVARAFFEDYNAHVAKHQALGTNDAEIQESQKRFYELDDEKQAWIVFAQQAIAESVFLDGALRDCTENIIKCYPTVTVPGVASSFSSGNAAKSKVSGCSTAFATAVMSVLAEHVEQAFSRRLHAFSLLFRTVFDKDVDPIRSIALLLHSDRGSEATDSSFASFSVDSSSRNELSSLAAAVSGALKRLHEEFYTTFTDIVADVQPILDVAESLPPELRSVAESVITGGTTHVKRRVSQLPVAFVTRLVALLEDLTMGTSQNAIRCKKRCDAIYTENWEAAPILSNGESELIPLKSLLAAKLLENLSDSAGRFLLQAVREHAADSHGDSANNSLSSRHSVASSSDSTTKLRIDSQVSLLLKTGSQSLRMYYVEAMTSLASESLLEQVYTCAVPVPSSNGGDVVTLSTAGVNISSGALNAARVLDEAVGSCCCILGNAVPVAVKKVVSAASTSSVQNAQGKAQLDIERLFARPVQIYPLLHEHADDLLTDSEDQVTTGSFSRTSHSTTRGGSDGIGSDADVPAIVARAMFKNLLEELRPRLLPPARRLQVQQDILYLKAVCAALIGRGGASAPNSADSDIDIVANQAKMALVERLQSN
eukprot:GSChrysophyteH1.ASY1.ANO1.387.1 assembled CDS